jgi:purine-binding chemotaxis protein CheW
MMTETLDQGQDGTLADDSIDSGTSNLRQFVTFMSGDEVFAVDLAPVQEIIRIPEVVRVPLAPSTLDGLANLRGQILPVVSLRRLFGFADRDYDDASRVVVIDVGQPMGFVVDRVSRVVSVDPSKIEGVETIQSTIDTGLLSGVVKDVGGHAMIMVLRFDVLVEREFEHLAKEAPRGGPSQTATDGLFEDNLSTAAELPLVSFHVEGQEYAVAIEDVQEIVQVPEAIVKVPRAQNHVLGIMTLRNRLLPLVSLRQMFRLTDRPLDEKSRIVVLEFGSLTVGMAVDGVSEVLRVPKDSVEAMPTLLARDAELADISGLCQVAGNRMVSIITARNLFDHPEVKEALEKAAELEASPEAAEVEEESMDDEQVVVFRLDREEFGVPITSVQEIVRVPDELVRVPKAPESVEGVINLRGAVLPVVDLRVRLGLPRVERSDRQRIMVFLLGGIQTGFIVDMVAEVLKVPHSAIEESPRLSEQQGKMLSRMANLGRQGRMVQILDPSHLIEGGELADVAAAVKDAHDQAPDR